MRVRGVAAVAGLLAAGAWGLLALLGSGDDGLTAAEPADHGARAEAPAESVVLRGVEARAAAARGPSPGPVAGGSGRSRRFRGHVFDAEGSPVVGAVVTVLEASGPATLLPTTTDGTGAFEWSVPEGTEILRVSVSAPGYAATTTVGPDPGWGVDAVAVLKPGGEITGRVVDAETGDLLAGVRVDARPAVSPEGGSPVPGRWREDGTFALAVRGAGPFVVTAGSAYLGGPAPHDEYVVARVESVAAGTRDLVVPMRRGLSIEGRILDDAGRPLTRAVTVDAVARTPAGDPDYTTRRIVVVAAGAELRVPGLRPGTYDLTFAFSADFSGTSSDAAATVVRGIAAGTTGLEVRMNRGSVLEGRVADDRGEPVSGLGFVYVYLEGDLGRTFVAHATVPGDGTFRTGPLDPSRRYDLLATGFPGFRSATVRGVGPLDRDLVVRLLRGGRIAGRVATPDGRAVPVGVPVGAAAEGADPAAPGARVFAYTAADGTFALEGLGDHAFSVEAGGGRSGYLATEVKTGVAPGTVDLLLVVNLGVELAGALVDGAGEPVSTPSLVADDGVRVGAMRPYAQVGADGRFLLRGLRAGRVRLHAMIGGTGVPLGEFEAPAEGLRVTVPAR